jgi:hypothetical protein
MRLRFVTVILKYLILDTFSYDLLVVTSLLYEGVSRSSGTGPLEQELQMVQLSATRFSCIAILWVSLVNFAAITLCVASQQVILNVSVYFVMTQSGNFWIHSLIPNSVGMLYTVLLSWESHRLSSLVSDECRVSGQNLVYYVEIHADDPQEFLLVTELTLREG